VLFPAQAPSVTRQQAAVVARLHTDPSWIRRRTDRIVVLDRTRARWATELEICLPDLADPDPAKSITLPELPLPLVHKQKRLLTGFSVTTARNQGVSTLTAKESRVIVAEMVLSEAQQILTGRGLFASGFDQSVEWVLLRFSGTADEGAAAFQWLINASATGPPGSSVARDQAEALMQSPFTRSLLKEFAAAYPIVALVPNEPGTRHILWIAHDDDTGGRIVLPGGTAASYHAELSCPDGVRFSPSIPMTPLNLPAIAGEEDPTAGGFWQQVISDDLLAVHVAAPLREAKLALDVRQALRVEHHGIGAQARTAAWMTLGVFVGGAALRARGVQPLVESAPILVGVASGVVGLLATRSRAATQREVATQPRLVLWALSTLIAAAAVALALRFPGDGPPPLDRVGWGWRAAIWSLLGLAAIVAVAWVERARRSW
jgi:hypothetical protein